MGTQVFNFSIPIIRDWFHFARKRLRQLTSSPAIDLNQVWETLHLQHKVYLPTASDLNNQDLRFDLAGVMHWDFMEEVGGDGFDAEDDRDELQMDDFANDWRDQFDADVVVGLVDANYAGGIFGVAYLPEIGPGGNPDFAHCIVEADAPAGRFTFTHEIAHLFRCRHDEDPGFANAVPFARGRIFDDINGVERITVMAQLGFGQRIQHFSNPNVNFNGVATGVVNERDNARQLGEIALDIADYDLGAGSLAPIIGGTTTGDNNTIGSWYVTINHCANATNYLWETSTDGFSYTVVQNGTSANYSQQLPFNSDLYLRVTVTGLDGDVATAFLTVYNEDSQSCDPCAMVLSFSDTDLDRVRVPLLSTIYFWQAELSCLDVNDLSFRKTMGGKVVIVNY